MGTVADRRGADFRKGVARREHTCYALRSTNRGERPGQSSSLRSEERYVFAERAAQVGATGENDSRMSCYVPNGGYRPVTYSLRCSFFLFSDRQRKSP